MSLLEISEVGMKFGGFSALESISLSISADSVTAIIGPNGAGKTTLLNCICGMYRHMTGDIRLDGESLVGLRPDKIARRGVSRTFQNVENMRSQTVLDLAMLGAERRGRATSAEAALRMPGARRHEAVQRERVVSALEALGIAEYKDERLEAVPYAVRKTADLARAVVGSPRLLLLDEPSTGMAAAEKERLFAALADLRDTWYSAAVVIDHDLDFLQATTDRAIVLDFGRKIAEGLTAEVLSDKAVVQAYLGVPAVSGDSED